MSIALDATQPRQIILIQLSCSQENEVRRGVTRALATLSSNPMVTVCLLADIYTVGEEWQTFVATARTLLDQLGQPPERFTLEETLPHRRQLSVGITRVAA